jgi:hypothetical protein
MSFFKRFRQAASGDRQPDVTILREILHLAPTILSDLSLRVVNSIDDGVNSLVDLRGQHITVRFTKDRGSWIGDVAEGPVPVKWNAFDSIAVLLGKDHRRLRDNALSFNPVMLRLMVNFLIENCTAIEDAYSPQNLEKTRERLERIGELRFQEPFPNASRPRST